MQLLDALTVLDHAAKPSHDARRYGAGPGSTGGVRDRRDGPACVEQSRAELGEDLLSLVAETGLRRGIKFAEEGEHQRFLSPEPPGIEVHHLYLACT